MLDLSAGTGFQLALDVVTGEVTSRDGFRYRRATRTVGQLADVLRSPGALPPDTPAYDVHYPVAEPDRARALLAPRHLTFSPVVLPPLTIGGEFVKTAGHYHPAMPGARVSYPEVYSGIHGRLLLFLQRRSHDRPDTPLDCALLELTPGVSATVPPDYAHVLINPSAETAVMAGLYCTDFQPDYREVTAHRGLAYYLVQAGEGCVAEANPRYADAPPLARPAQLSGTIFEPPDDPAVPLWRSFAARPDRYAFLHDAAAAADRFAAYGY